MKKYSLGELADPTKKHEPINIDGVDESILKSSLYDMKLVRSVETKLREKMYDKSITCPCHLCIGQEAIPIGIAHFLRKTDRVFGGHRSHAHFLSLNGNVAGLFAEVLGKYDGVSKGMGGSMHIIDRDNGFYGSVPIVAATIPIATGAGFAAKMDGGDDIAVSYFGDAACEEGPFHESLNLASNYGIPVLYVCENNMASSHMPIELRQPAQSTARFADAHLIENKSIDANDVVEVYKAAKEAISYIRKHKKPYFLEMVTYRWSGHVGPTEDSDVGVKRSENHTIWKGRDPIGRLEKSLLAEEIQSQEDLDKMQESINVVIENSWDKAEKGDYPPLSALLDLVYHNKLTK